MLGDVVEMIEKIPTCELVDELERRGCQKIVVPPYGDCEVCARDANLDEIKHELYDGPVVIIVIDD